MAASIDALLMTTSRTFALAIPLLPEPTKRSTCIAYLLFRIADTLEDAELWPRRARVEALSGFGAVLGDTVASADDLSSRWLEQPPTRDRACLELLRAMPRVLSELRGLDPATQAIVLHHARRTAQGMRETVASMDDSGALRLASIEALRSYCYVVAGIVGELLTALFVHDAPSLQSVRSVLVEHQAAFGEGLQLVNILKDQSVDAGAGRAYLPASVPRAEILALARADMGRAREYIGALERGRAPNGFVAFTSLSVDLADATLDRIEVEGAGAKVPRSAVMQMLARVTERMVSHRA
jgi:farnesyl-diphosphate farnesyltransferase